MKIIVFNSKEVIAVARYAKPVRTADAILFTEFRDIYLTINDDINSYHNEHPLPINDFLTILDETQSIAVFARRRIHIPFTRQTHQQRRLLGCVGLWGMSAPEAILFQTLLEQIIEPIRWITTAQLGKTLEIFNYSPRAIHTHLNTLRRRIQPYFRIHNRKKYGYYLEATDTPPTLPVPSEDDDVLKICHKNRRWGQYGHAVFSGDDAFHKYC